MAKTKTYIKCMAIVALLLAPMLTWCTFGDLTSGDGLSHVKFTVPSGELPPECLPPEEPEPEGDADSDATDPTDPGCELTITLSPLGGGADISDTTPIGPDNAGEMTLSVAPGIYNVYAKVDNAEDTLLYELGSATSGTASAVTHTFIPGATELTLWLKQVVGDIPPSEFSTLPIVSLMARDNEPGDGGDEYRVEAGAGRIDFTVDILTNSTPEDAKTVTLSGSVSPTTNCGVMGSFTGVEDDGEYDRFTGTWQAGAIGDVQCTLTFTATETDDATGDVLRTGAISFPVWTLSGGGGGTNRDFTVIYNTAPEITDISVNPSQINISSNPLEDIAITVTATDGQEQGLIYELELAQSIKRNVGGEEFVCLLLPLSPTETLGEFSVTDASWGECPAEGDESSTEYIEYVEGSSVVVFEATVTEVDDDDTTDVLEILSAQGRLSVHVMELGVAE